MGSFGGHVLPGSFFIGWSIWWAVKMYYRYFMAKLDKTEFTSSATFNFIFLKGRLKRWPIEGALKIFLPTVAAIIEIITAFDEKGKFWLGNGQHATMFMFFVMSGVIDVLLYFRVTLPPGLDYLSMALGFTIEFLLFKFHLHGRPPLDVLIHTLLLYVLAATIIILVAEMKFRHNILIALCRSFLVLLQGTWFLQVAFILYDPNKPEHYWKGDDHENIVIATLFFAWHVAGTLIAILLIGGLVKFFVVCRHGRVAEEAITTTTPFLNGVDKRYTQLSMLNETESDLENELSAVRKTNETTFNTKDISAE